MKPVPLPHPDIEHERAIERARRELLTHWTPEKWEALKRLVGERSAAQVARMEQRKGLA